MSSSITGTLDVSKVDRLFAKENKLSMIDIPLLRPLV